MTPAPSNSWTNQLLVLTRDIKLAHSVFALPFALLASFLAADYRDRPLAAYELLLIVLCMVLGRTFAMTVNRLADARIDAANPRTAGRALPSGRLSRRFALFTLLATALAFIAAAALFVPLSDNPLPLWLSPLVLLFLAFYSFTKRFTWLCHVYLGCALAVSPAAAALAIEPPVLLLPDLWLLCAMVACWVAGFDVIYALQDLHVDRAQHLHSMPAKLGVEPALWISRALHLLCVLCLLAVWRQSTPLDYLFLLGVLLVVLLLILEHALVWRSATHHIHMAFFTLNGVISLVLGTLGIADVLR